MLIGSLVAAAILAACACRAAVPLSRGAIAQQQGWVLMLLAHIPA